MRKIITVLIFCIAFPIAVFAMQPPSEGEMQKYIEDGTYSKRMENAQKIGNNKTELPKFANSGDVQLFSIMPAYSYYMPSTGNVNMALIMVDFEGERFAETDLASYQNLFNGVQNTSNQYYPLESLKAYYQRSSYGNLTINTTVYKCSISMTRSDYTAYIETITSGNLLLGMVQDIMTKTESTTTINFSDYDNNNDNLIDGLAFVWKGPNEGWGSDIWWSMMANCHGMSGLNTYDGKTLSVFSWFSGDNHLTPTGSAKVAVHETGHLMGLPDYYDYDEFYGPDGGTGGIDMMDSNKGDHNSFSKYILGWIQPTVITTDTTINLKAVADVSSLADGETRAVIVASDAGNTDNFCEYYLIEYRKPIGNDLCSSSQNLDGVAIWHIKADLTNGDFTYDNSFTHYKLLSLVEADGNERIEDDPSFYFYGSSTGKNVLFGQDQTFGINTFPSSDKYNGLYTGVNVKVNSFTGNDANITVSFTSNDTVKPTEISAFPRNISSMSSTAVCMSFSSNVYIKNESLITFTTSNGVSIGGTARIYKNKAYFLPEKQLLPSETYILNVPQGAIKDSYGNNLSSDVTYSFTTPEEDGVNMETIKVANTTGYVGECSTYMSDGKLLSAAIDAANSNILWLTVTNNGVVINTKSYTVNKSISLIKSIIPITGGYLLSYNSSSGFVIMKFDGDLVKIKEVPVDGQNVSNLAEINGYYYCYGKYKVLKINSEISAIAGQQTYSDLSFINNGIKTSDGGSLLVGQNSAGNISVVKIDSSLNKVWAYTDQNSSEGMDAVETSDGYVILKLANYINGNFVYEANSYITKLNKLGALVSNSAALGTTLFLNSRAPQMKLDSSGNIYISLYTNRMETKPYCYNSDGYYTKGFDSEVIKLSPTFEKLWRRCLPGNVALGSSPMLCGTDNFIMSGYEEKENCLLLYNFKNFKCPEIIEYYTITNGINKKVFASVKNTKIINSKPMLALGVYDSNSSLTNLIMDDPKSITPNELSPLSIQYTDEGFIYKVFLFDDTSTIKPLN